MDIQNEHSPAERTAPAKPIKVKIRLDFKGTSKPGRFLFGGKSQEKSAEDNREQQVALFRNIPMQGIYIEDIDLSVDVFTVFDDVSNNEVAYAPVTLTICADTLEDVVQFITRKEFRKIEIIEPRNFSLSKHDTEKLFFQIHRQLKEHINNLERQYLK
jgi:hypothetical protein